MTLSKLENSEGEDLAKYLQELTGRSIGAIKNALKAEPNKTVLPYLVQACEGDEELAARLLPFVALMRRDSWGQLMVYPEGSFAVVPGAGRRETATHYTPRSLTEPIVRDTLEPLVYTGPAEGKPREQWQLKSSAELLELKICDIACGSGAFLVEVIRYLGQRLVEAWAEAEEQGKQINYHGDVVASENEHELLSSAIDERILIARRLVAQSCIYGVDINPLAVELAKLSIWLITLAKNKPFEFLDHAMRCGDSLIGLHDIEQLRHFSLNPEDNEDFMFEGPLEEAVEEAVGLRLNLEDMPANTVADVRAQEKLLAKAEEKIARLKCAADMLVAAVFWGQNASDKKERLQQAAHAAAEHFENGKIEEFRIAADNVRQGQKMFHWPLIFPEVVVMRGGFDAIVGNPPFMKGTGIGQTMGGEYRTFLGNQIAKGVRASFADLCGFFVLRTAELIGANNFVGLITTDTISQGDTKVLSLDQLADRGITFHRARQSSKWPGSAMVRYAMVWFRNGDWTGAKYLDEESVAQITSSLEEPKASGGKPLRLASNAGLAFKGTTVGCKGFVISEEEANALLSRNPENENVIEPFLVGQDFTTRVDQSPSRYAINFRDWAIEEATSYPECLELLEERVKPYRDAHDGQKHEKDYWKFSDKRLKSYASIEHLERVLFHSVPCKYLCFAFVPTGMVYSAPHFVVGIDDYSRFGILQSSIHETWVLAHCSMLGLTLRYAPSDLFDTFPFPLKSPSHLENSSRQFYEYRAKVIQSNREGLTKTYNRFHDSNDTSEDVQELRELHVEMDQAVAAAYGWDDLDLEQGFHETKQGIRFTINEHARSKVLQRLLILNHQRYEEEVSQGMHDKKKKKRSVKKKTTRKTKKIDKDQVKLDF